MNRLDIDQSMIEQLAADSYNAGLTEDANFPEQHRRTRIALTDTTTPVIRDSNLKRYDDVHMRHWINVRVVGPARWDNFFLAYIPPSEGNEFSGLVELMQDAIDDRAPYNENETPMPVSTRPPWDMM